jgi:hypothetical protein
MATAPDNATPAPRWEWRTFAKTLPALRNAIGAIADAAAPRESGEIYLLNLYGPHNAKIRNGVLDIKHLHQVNADGLELWNPAFKAQFPVTRGQLAEAFLAWGLAAPSFARESYTLEQFLAEIVAPHDALRRVDVKKTRSGFEFGGCIAEFAGVVVNGVACESFCLEHENPALILAALKQLHLQLQANINYPEGLKRALGVANPALVAA